MSFYFFQAKKVVIIWEISEISFIAWEILQMAWKHSMCSAPTEYILCLVKTKHTQYYPGHAVVHALEEKDRIITLKIFWMHFIFRRREKLNNASKYVLEEMMAEVSTGTA